MCSVKMRPNPGSERSRWRSSAATRGLACLTLNLSEGAATDQNTNPTSHWRLGYAQPQPASPLATDIGMGHDYLANPTYPEGVSRPNPAHTTTEVSHSPSAVEGGDVGETRQGFPARSTPLWRPDLVRPRHTSLFVSRRCPAP